MPRAAPLLPAPDEPLPDEPLPDERLPDEPALLAGALLAGDLRFGALRGACVDPGCGLVSRGGAFRPEPLEPELVEPLFGAAFFADEPEELDVAAVPDFAEREPWDVAPLPPLFDVVDLPAAPPLRVELRSPLVARLAMGSTVSVRHLRRHTNHRSPRAPGRSRRRSGPAGRARVRSSVVMATLPSTPDGPPRDERAAPDRSPALWRALTRIDRLAVALSGRLEVTGDIGDEVRGRPLLLAANHIGNLDALVLIAACSRIGVAPRFLATGGLFDTPVLGAVLERSGHVRVDRATPSATRALEHVSAALREDPRPVLVYPEGRISLEPDLWPERGKTGVSRMALASGAAVVPISQWGAHEIMFYGMPSVRGVRDLWALFRSWLRALRRRPALRVHFGEPVDLGDLSPDRTGDAARARDRIMRAITRNLAPLRADEPGAPNWQDPTRTTTDRRSPWRD